MQNKESDNKKKTAASKSGSKSNTKSTSKSTAKSTSKSASKSTAAKRVKENDTHKTQAENGFSYQTAPFIVGVIAVVLAVCMIIGEGNIGGFVRKLMTGMFGGAAYLLPILMLIRAFMHNRDCENGVNTSKNFVCAMLYVFITMLMHIVADGRDVIDAKIQYSDGILLRGGGAVGGVLGQLLVGGFGRVCSVIIIVCAMLLAFLYLIGVTPHAVWVFIAYKFGITIENSKQKRAENEEKRRNAPPTRSQVKEEEYLRYLRAKKERERQERQRAALEAQAQNGSTENKEEVKPSELRTVYHVRKHKVVEIPTDDNTVLTVNSETGEVLSADKSVDDVQKTEQNVIPDQSAFEAAEERNKTEEDALSRAEREQLIYNEVMKRTRERMENNRQKNAVSVGDNNYEGDAVTQSDTSQSDTSLSDAADKADRDVYSMSPFDDDFLSEEDVAAAETEVFPDNAYEPSDNDDVIDSDADDTEAKDVGDSGGQIFDAVELAAQSIQEKLSSKRNTPKTVNVGGAVSASANRAEHGTSANPEAVSRDFRGKAATIASEFEPDEPDDTAEDENEKPEIYSEYDAAEISEENNVDALDVSGLFVNPEDAELLDKLNQIYRREPTKVSLPATAQEVKMAEEPKAEYRFPPVNLLTEAKETVNENIREELQDNAVKLVDTLKSFKVETKIENISRGPTITRYELKPEAGTKVRSITNLVDDIALNLATSGVRIEAPIPGKSAVGIEVPNKKQETVHLRSLIEDERFAAAKSQLTVCLGADVAGETVFLDIAKMPHLLIAGATGSGKSVCINSIITSLLYKASPADVKLILIDPKKVEMNIYNGIPHLLVPVVSEPKKAAGALSWAVGEMERRYGLMEEVGMRDIKSFNEATKDNPDYEYMPRIVIIIDELADLMMTAPDDVEDSICRIAQKARAAGMHLIIGTQRPSVDVITGLIKANIPSRIAFRTSSQIDSRTIIDVGQAANLIGMGDMLYSPVGALKPFRVQGAFVSENDVIDVVKYIKEHDSEYNSTASEKIVNEIEREAQKCGAKKGKGVSTVTDDDEDFGDTDELLPQAIEIAVHSRKIATSLLQRELKIGYGRAARIIDTMEEMGYVSAPNGTKPREVLISEEDYLSMRLNRDGI